MSREGAGRLFWLGPSRFRQRAKPDLSIWAHQAGQMSGQELEVTVEVKKFSTLATFPKVRFTATMFRALEHTVLCSTELSAQHD